MKTLLALLLRIPLLAPLLANVMARVAAYLVRGGRLSDRHIGGLLRLVSGKASLRAMASFLHAALDSNPHRSEFLDQLQQVYLEMGKPELAWQAVQDVENALGFSPDRRLRLLLRLQYHGATELLIEALPEFRNRLAPKYWQFLPCLLERLMPGIDELIDAASADDSPWLDIAFGRIGFVFREFALSSALLKRGIEAGHGSPLDELAMHYGAARDGLTDGESLDIGQNMDRMLAEAHDPDEEAHCLILLCELGLHYGQWGQAEDCLNQWQARAMPSSEISGEAHARVQSLFSAIMACRQGQGLVEHSVSDFGPRVHKVFVCGNGWSGSGAMHNALQAYDSVVEFPQAEPTALANKGSFSEVSFFQGAAGLGSLWRMLDRGQQPGWREIWDLFRVHVLGAAWVGYPEFKCSVMARTMQGAFGEKHWQVFHDGLLPLLSAVAADNSPKTRQAIADLAEALCLQAVSHSGQPPEQAVLLLNNAVFARNADLLGMFENAKAVLVHRDPRDVWADRKHDDDRHWRTVDEFARFHAINEQTTRRRIAQLTSATDNRPVRRVAFEGLVCKAELRDRLCQWALAPVGGLAVRQVLDPSRSQGNIGIYGQLLAPQEQSVLARMMKELE